MVIARRTAPYIASNVSDDKARLKLESLRREVSTRCKGPKLKSVALSASEKILNAHVHNRAFKFKFEVIFNTKFEHCVQIR